jgi:oxazoline/thiazoline synthase
MDCPRIKAHLSAEVVGTSKVFLVAEDHHYLVQGEASVRVLPYLDGKHTVGEIASALSNVVSLPEIIFAVRKYDMFGHLADGRPDLPDRELAYWDALGVDPAAAADLLRSARLPVVVVGDVATEPIFAALSECGLNVTASSLDAELAAAGDARADSPVTVVLVDDYLDQALGRLNSAFLGTGRRWLLAKPTGMMLWLGPLLQLGRTGCWACLAQRVDGNRQVERYLLGKRGDKAPFRTSRAATTASVGVLGGLLATEVARIAVTGTSPKLDGQMVTLDLRTLETAEHVLIRQPQCPACGDPSIVSKRSPKVTITPNAVRFNTDGGYRVEPPSKTYTRIQRHISPFLGAISSLSTMAEVDNGVTYSYTAGHNFAMSGDNIDLLRRNMRGQSGGKGRTDIQARTSAVCEAIERYCGVWRGDESVQRAAYDDLGPDVAIPPNDLLLFSQHQFDTRGEWNAHPGNFLQVVPEPFRSYRPADWTTAWSLTGGRERLVPSAYAWFGHPDLNDHFYCFSDANGNASGNTIEEAVLQGFCELAERDSVAVWWYNRARRPAVDLDSLHDPYVDVLREFYAGMDRSLWILDITSDLGIPTFVGVSHRLNHPAQDILVGFGAHLNPRIAAMRALTEVNQFLPAVEQRDAEGNTVYFEDDEYTLSWWKEATLASEPWVCPDETQQQRTLSDYASLGGEDIADDVEECVRRAAASGLEVIVLDQTRPDLDLNVVKVMAPGTRHFWRRLGAGRLYEVPVRLGWLDAPQSEDQLNPWSVFF